MTLTAPPYRADHVGSLLRPIAVKNARRAFYEDKSISAEQLRAIEDEAIVQAIRMQESIGLRVVTDGEIRRSFWHYDFMGGLNGLDLVQREPDEGVQFHGVTLRPTFPTITGPLNFPDDHPMLEHFRFLAAHTQVTPKISIPGPSCVHYRAAKKDIHPPQYQDMEVFFADLAKTYAQAVQKFYEAGCRYLQLDETNLAYLCDAEQRQMLRDRGDDPDQLPSIYADLINKAISDRPDDMTITMHLCRGNFRSLWIAQGGYEPVAEILFNQINANGYFMEYDTERAGGFEPLRFVPKGKTIVLGLVTEKAGTLESKDTLKRRIDEASKYIDADQLCLSPQCGFASTEEGNTLSTDEQWAKLARIVEVAAEIWGN